MKAVYFKDQSVSLVERPVPRIPEGEALIRVAMAGICNTDIELFRGYYGFEGIAGHEFVGVVEKAPAKPELEGKRVVGEINCGCGKCPRCLSGDPRHCPNRTTLGIKGRDGVFAEYTTLPLENLLLVGDTLKDEQAVFTELLAAALEVSRQVHITNNMKTAVLGDGKLGILCSVGLRHFNSQILLIGKHEEKLSIARNQGVRTFQVESSKDAKKVVEEFGQFDLVVEITGRPDGIGMALEMVRPEGTVVAKTTSHKPSEIDLAKVVVDEISIVGSRCGDFALAISFLENGWVDVLPMIEEIYSFSEFEKAFFRAMQPGAKKVLVRF